MAVWRQVSRLLQVPKVRFPRSSAIHAAFVMTSIGGSCLIETLEKPAGAATLDGIAVLADQRHDALALPVNQAPATPGPTLEAAEPSSTAPTSVWQRNALLGNTGGIRNAFAAWGMTLGLAETSEVLGNVKGGQRQGIVYEGLTQASIGIDLNAAIGLAGGTVNISALQIHGRGLSTNNIINLNTVSGIEASRSTRLFELWDQQSFLSDQLDVKIGQISADTEFVVTQYGGLFINGSFGWPGLPGVDLPSGGPAYPLATPAVRLRIRPTPSWTALVALFNGSPAGLATGNPQQRDRSGTNFDIASGAFVIGELQYSKDQLAGALDLPGTYKIGGWYNSNAFTDQFYTGSAVSSIQAFGSFARSRKNDWSVYAVIDQMVYRPGKVSASGVSVFFRAMGAPGNRNLVNVFVDAGVVCKGLFDRDNDTVGLGVNWARISDTARAEDSVVDRSSYLPRPVRSSETDLELSYQAQLAPWWILQPDVQYVFKPGAGIVSSTHPAKVIGDALVLGLRSNLSF